MTDPIFTAEQYIEDVLSGRTIACSWVRKAVERHARDLETAPDRGFRFDPVAAKKAIAFFSFLKHYKGEWAGRPITLAPWQQFIIWTLYGWVEDETGLRRFRTAYIEVARKNGKTTMAAGLGLFALALDGEPGAEVYSCATKRDQARICHGDATQMVKSSPQLRKQIGVYKSNIHVTKTASKFEPLSADYNTMDGLNVHMAIADELHAWPNRSLWDVLETATGARRQPLMVAITTAGFDRHSFCWTQHEYVEKILDQAIDDDTFFGIIFTLDEGDDWEDESVWIKANPNLGTSKKIEDMRRKAEKAKHMPSALNAFLRLELNIWTEAETRWIGTAAWVECGAAVNPAGLRGRTAYAGLDLSSNIDISACVLIFPPETEDGSYKVVPRFWIPEDSVHERVSKDRVPYDVWIRDGLVEATPGNVIDYDYILHQIGQDYADYDLRKIMFDRWGSTKIVNELMEIGGEDWVVQFGQGFVSMNAPMKELERLILARRLAHGGNPVLTWMAHNLVARQDPAGNIKPDKEKSREKIDGMVALIMALDGALRIGAPQETVYNTRGLLSL